MPRFCALLVKEAFKTWGDTVAEVREAVDFLRYYANEAERIMAPIVTLPGPHGRKQRAAPDRARCLGLHQPLELSAGDLHGPGGGRAGHRQHRAGQARRADARRGAGGGQAVACRRRTCRCTATAARPRRDRGRGPGGGPRGRRGVHRLHPGGQDHPACAGGQRRPHRAADCRDRRHQRHAGGQHRPARAGGRRRGAKRLPLGRAALLGAAPAVRARGHCRRRDRDDPGRGSRAGHGRPGRPGHRCGAGD
jgi:hypothetical protein